jgi:hypothetical protein
MFVVTWARYDDEFSLNRKVGQLVAQGVNGVAAIGLHLLANTYSRHNGTGGVIEPHVPRLLCGPGGTKLARMLAEVGMFDPRDEGGWTVHDYDEFHDPSDPNPNRSAAERKKELSEKRAAAGRLGGQAKAAKEGSKPSSNGTGKQMAMPQQTSSPVPVPTSTSSLDDLPLPTNDLPGGQGRRIEDICTCYATIAVETAKATGVKVRSDESYHRKAVMTARSHEDLSRYATEWPDAPPSAIAAWLHGDKHSMAYYDRRQVAP